MLSVRSVLVKPRKQVFRIQEAVLVRLTRGGAGGQMWVHALYQVLQQTLKGR